MLCAQVIFFPGVSGQGLAIFKRARAIRRGGTTLFQEMRQCPFGEEQHSSRHLRNNGIHSRDAAYEVCY